MEIYKNFAAVYDLFMDEVPYTEWCRQIKTLLLSAGIKSGIVADLGCGTGSLTQQLSKEGYDMIGIDNSYDMLDIALSKNVLSGTDILYLCQDIREFELYGTCAAIISRCDTLNYITKFEELVQMFKLVNNYLDPEAPFIFDCNSVYKYESILADNVFAENREEGSFIWENDYNRQSCINSSSLTFFIRDKVKSTDLKALNEVDSVYRRFEELHLQRAYSLEELKKAAEMSGLLWGEVYDADSFAEVKQNTQRYLICLYENGKRER